MSEARTGLAGISSLLWTAAAAAAAVSTKHPSQQWEARRSPGSRMEQRSKELSTNIDGRSSVGKPFPLICDTFLPFKQPAATAQHRMYFGEDLI